MLKETILPLIINRLPEFLAEEYPLFVEFMKSYFGWLEKDENFIRVLLDFKSNTDVSSESSIYVDDILKSLGFDTTREIQIRKSQLILFLRDYYLSRGSEESFKFLFKVFFNKDAQIDYPRKKLAMTSNTVFASKTYMYTTAVERLSRKFRRIVDDPNAGFSTSITGIMSGSVTQVEQITEYTIDGRSFLEFSIIPPTTPFTTGEPVRIQYNDISFTETSLCAGKLTADVQGNQYVVGDQIYVTHPNSIRNGVYQVSKITSGKIRTAVVTAGGAGYQVGDMIFAEQTPHGAGFSAEVSEVDEYGAIVKAKVLNAGWGYRTVPNLMVASSAGTGAIVTANTTLIGGISEITAIHPIIFDAGILGTAVSAVSVRGSNTSISILPSSIFTTKKKNETPVEGVLGRSCVITDSNLFQQFSYEVISDEPSYSHKPISDMVHPVGYMRFNVFTVRSSDHVDIQDAVTSLKYRKFLPPRRAIDMPPVGTLFDLTTQYRIVKIMRSLGLLKPVSLSINTWDTVKLSTNFNNLPLNYKWPVLTSLASHKFAFEALDAEIYFTKAMADQSIVYQPKITEQ